MSVNENAAEVRGGLEKLRASLDVLKSGGANKRLHDFREAYPLIEQHLAGGVSQKALLEQFNAAYGYTLHPPQFRKLMDAERRLRQECGRPIACANCGQPLSGSPLQEVDCTEEA
jgi:hypothetical protein